MELKVSVSEAVALIKEVENAPAKRLEFIGMNIQKESGTFLRTSWSRNLPIMWEERGMSVNKVRPITAMEAIPAPSVSRVLEMWN